MRITASETPGDRDQGADSPAGDPLVVARKANPAQYGDAARSPPGKDDVEDIRSACGREGVA
jgi:hypothetical protein